MKDRVVRRDQQVRSTQFLSPHSISLLLPPTSAGRHSGLLVRLVILRNHISPDVAISRRAITLKNFDENANLASHFPPTSKINKIIQKNLKRVKFSVPHQMSMSVWSRTRVTKMPIVSTPTALSYVLAKRDSLEMDQLVKVIVILS